MTDDSIPNMTQLGTGTVVLNLPPRAVLKFAIPEADWSLGAPFRLPSSVAVIQLVHAEIERDVLLIWAEVLTNRRGQLGPRLIVHGTGHLIEPRESHMITIRDGGFVWHLYYSPEEPTS